MHSISMHFTRLNRSGRSKALLLLLLLALLAVPSLSLAAANDFSIDGANVYTGYIEDNDWLIVVKYKNVLEPYYGNDTSQNAFMLQLTTQGDVLLAQTPLPAWGYRPGSIYLSANATAALEWGTGYKIKMYGTGADHNTTNYTLVSADWKGSNLAIMDDWCLALATAMGSYDNTTYTTVTTEKGLVLNEGGGVIFITGIHYLDQVRPGIFQVVTSGIPHEEATATWAFWSTLPTWHAAVGPELAGIFNATGTLINVDGKTVGMLGIFILWAVVATTAFAVGHGTAGMALSLPVLALGTYFQFIPFAVMAVGIAVVVVLVIRELWWSKT